ncbi:integrase domain-containing protein, partial [Methylicorpusculum sp.]|uniref:integrase domain-containing protein n=2 Tax=Methylicorpusculum sp. TaxID=2713644 RepID=UPI002ABB9ED4
KPLRVPRHSRGFTNINYLSAVNCVMKLATDGDWQTVKPGLDCGIARRQFIPRHTKALSETRHRHLQQALGDRLAHLLALQRTFGLRFKESCLLNPKAALKQAEKFGFIVITAGTKGGRRRQVPCDDHGIGVLKAALTLQCGNSMIPDQQLSYVKFRKECYEQARSHGFAFHSERHAYAQMRYRELVKAPCPLKAGWPHMGKASRNKEMKRNAKLALKNYGIKLSEALQVLCEPYLIANITDAQYERLISLGVSAWNLAILPEPDRRALFLKQAQSSPEFHDISESELIQLMTQQLPETASYDLIMLTILSGLIWRKLDLFPRDDRIVKKFWFKRQGQKDRLEVESIIPESAGKGSHESEFLA